LYLLQPLHTLQNVKVKNVMQMYEMSLLLIDWLVDWLSERPTDW
jgi:hypothetical protein